MDEIRCPRCGKEAYVELFEDDDSEVYSFRCSTCGWKSLNGNDLIKRSEEGENYFYDEHN